VASRREVVWLEGSFNRKRSIVVRPISQQVVVVTGASSGIGRETAQQLARRGASVVLAARPSAALDAAAAEVEALGGTALAVPTDVSVWAEVQSLVAAAAERFGRIDTWVNAAAVSSYGDIASTPVEAITRLLEVDLLGQIHGVKAVLPVMREQGQGAIIGVSSALGVRSVPLQVPYCVAKHGLVALYEGLRLEEQRAKSGVSVTTILPGSINTPLFDVAPSWMGVRPAPIPPVYEASVAAQAILAAAEQPRRHVFVGGSAAQMAALQRLSPALSDRLLTVKDQIFVKQQRPDQPDQGENNLTEPRSGTGSVTGSFGAKSKSTSAYTSLVGLHHGRGRLLALAGGLAAAAALKRTR
jgi:NAD(P)-dependent dehydrogenase (short-subunit alcohol dehydrogenase family)